jgi:hypothetical protein
MAHRTAVVLATLLLAAGALHAADEPSLLEPLQPADLPPGCGCTFSVEAPNGSDAVFALDLASGEGLVRLEGSLLRFTRMSTTESRKSKRWDSVGDRTTEIWASGETELTIKYRTTFVCSENDTACTTTSYEGQLTVRHGSARQRVGVTGSCGCPGGA